MELVVDHVVLAASRLEALATRFAAAGLATQYGGPHSNAITHMSLLGFDDGSYLELIAPHRPGLQSPWWHVHMVRESGPCGWAVRSADIHAEAARLRGLGVEVSGPVRMSRRRPDGQLVEWEIAFVGEEGIGALHPFLIADVTPLELRSMPTRSVAGTELTGVAAVVLGVPEPAVSAETLRRVYGLPEPREVETARFGGAAWLFPGTPVAIAAEPRGSLAQRIAVLGPCPCGVLLTTRDLERSAARFRLGPREDWAGRSVAWFDGLEMEPINLGLIEQPD